MGDYEIRAVAKLKLDSVKDKALIEEIEDLVAHRKLGDYITGLLRFAAEHREDLEELGFNKELRSKNDSYKKVVGTLNDEMLDLKAKVDAVFDMAFSLKTAFETGRVTGLETQVDNVLAAQIVLQNQSNKLRRMFGEEVPLAFKGMAGEMRKADIDRAAKEAADLAVAHYGELLSDLANQFNTLNQQIVVQPTFVMGANMNQNIESSDMDSWEHNVKVANADFRLDKTTDYATENVEKEVENERPVTPESDEEQPELVTTKEIQFGGDLAALSNFFGM